MRKLAVLYFILWAFGFCGAISAQNLVPNPGFEQYKKIPVTFCRTAKEFNATVKGWTMPNEATADYFHSKCKANASTIKNNFAGFQNAVEGEAYAGIYCCMDNGINYSEYLKTKLIKPLKAGQKYVIQFYISLSEASQFAVDRIGVLFTKENLVQKNLFPLKYDATVESVPGQFFDDKTNWRQIRLSFIAKGGEKYMIIGNFHTGGTTQTKKVPVNKKKYYKENGCYYYIDDVCLAPETEDGNCICPIAASIDSLQTVTVNKDSVPINEIETEKPMVLSSVFFDTDKSVLNPESFPSLDSLVLFLKEESSFFITISGHTDNSGDEIKNKKLSEDRAKAVREYLIQKGINADRIRSEGWGSSRSISENETPQGRARNRRVEYSLHL